MKSRHILYYFLAFLLALGLRFIGLGAVPLTDKEAELALQALALARGENPLLAGQPGYILLTSIPFYLFESTNFLARLVPALAGSLLVFVPYFFRDTLGKLITFILTTPLPNTYSLYTFRTPWLYGYKTVATYEPETIFFEFSEYKSWAYKKNSGNRPTIVLAFLLAIAPGLVAASRQANGTMLAVTFGVFAWIAWQKNRPQLAGIFAGIALLGGASVWMGLLIASLTWALAQNLLPTDESETETDITEASEPQERSRAEDAKVAAKFTGGTLLLVGSLFFLSPNGLSAFAASFAEFLQGWRYSSGVPTLQMLGGLLTYYPLALLFGMIASVRGIVQRERTSLTLSLWALVALLLVIFYPSHQVSDLLWAALPLWILSAREISKHLHLPNFDRNETFGVFALTVLLLSFAWLNMTGAGSPGALLSNRLMLLGGALLLLIISLALIAIGWSLETATLGGVWGSVFMLGLYTLSMAWGASGLRTPKGSELWDNASRVTQTGLLLDTVDSILTWSQQIAQTPTITVYGVDSPALLWALRNHNVDMVTALDLDATSELVITPQAEQVELASAYRGQDFVWRQVPNWQTTNWPRWIAIREVPTQSEQIILWARNDLFFDSQNQ